jgi:pyruvate/2-oxoglutarate dehydrogenase complex dihydrolipoamide acyltransferase (E2) component
MTDPSHVLIFAALVFALLTAMVLPPPAEPADDRAEGPLVLLGAGCVAVIAMGVLALLGQPAQSAVCGAIAWLLVMPCVWLARAPRPAGGWGDDAEDDDGGGSPPPHRPSAPPAPDDRPDGLRPAPVTQVAWTAPRTAPVMATAAKLRLMQATAREQQLAAQHARQLAAQHAQQLAAQHAQQLTAQHARQLAAQQAQTAAAEAPAAERPPLVAPRSEYGSIEHGVYEEPRGTRRRGAHAGRLPVLRRPRRWCLMLVRGRGGQRRAGRARA